MPARLFAAVLAVLALAAGRAAAQTENWVPAIWSQNAVYELDLNSISRKGDIAESWFRERPLRAKRSGATSERVVLAQRYDDCVNRRVALGMALRTGGRAAAQTIAPGSGPLKWEPLAPGTVDHHLWRVACAATSPPAEEPLLKTIDDAEWVALGRARDDSYTRYFAKDRVLQIGDTEVIVFTRLEYAEPETMDGLPIRHVVYGSILDCKEAQGSDFASDQYMAPTVRVRSQRTDPDRISLKPLDRNSLIFQARERICAAAVKIDRSKTAADEPKIATGTAWAVTKGYLVTSAHVVEGAKAMVVYNNGERMGEARVVTADPTNDLAILKLEKWTGPPLTALPISTRAAALGKSVFTLGYPAPGILGQRIKMTAGEISSTAGIQDDARILQISAPIQGGNSGGPVMGWDGAVVGVVESKLNRFSDDDETAPTPQMVNYAVKAAYLRPLLDDLPDLGNHKPLKGQLSDEALIEEARKAVFMLVVAR
ncbi:MAG: serine protease [Pseudomonadota bacterium]|nr:serine protease [Pseudomonadota bacterium]